MGKMHSWEDLHYETEMYGAVSLSFGIVHYFICFCEGLALKPKFLIKLQQKNVVTGERCLLDFGL